MPARTLSVLLIVGVWGQCAPHATAAESLATRVDAAIEAKAKADGVLLAGVASDAEFLRRVYLDLAGTIPTSATTKAFLADTAPNKRAALIDQLLASADYAPRLADWLNVALMERLGDSPEWAKYLRAAFSANKPYDVMVREILRADARDTANAGAAFWLAKRLENYGQQAVEYSALTRDVGRLFLGKNFQCCECHDHLFIDEYKQQDFQGLHAFFKNTYLAKPGVVGEKLTAEKLGFASVFTKVQMATAPALPGAAMLEIPPFGKGMEFSTPPDKKTNDPGVLKFSTLAAVAEQLPTAKNKDFTRNAVNRLWFAVMGRGLVHPLDLHHGGNPASHPELLALLADEFAAHKFDIKWLLRELALTKTYQRSSLSPAGNAMSEPKYFAIAIEKRLTTEQLLLATLRATGTDPKAADTLRPKFLKAFANQAREPEDEVTPSLKAALFLLHDPSVLDMMKAKPGNLVERAAKLSDAEAVEELYLAVLSRKPTVDEKTLVAKVLARHPDSRTEAVGRIVWALLASMEFGVNH